MQAKRGPSCCLYVLVEQGKKKKNITVITDLDKSSIEAQKVPPSRKKSQETKGSLKGMISRGYRALKSSLLISLVCDRSLPR